MKKYKKLLIIILLVIGLFLFLYSPLIFQEGNPWPQIKGIVQLNFKNTGMVKLSDSDNEYMTKSKNGVEIIKAYLKDKDYNFIEQMGSAYLFESLEGKSAIVIHKYYSRYYSLWRITENQKNSQIINTPRSVPLVQNEVTAIAEELKECLPKSDMASHEKCNELLSTIRNFNDCVQAGFPIMKSKPPQCATPDGRTFREETNSTWGIVLATLDSCEVRRVFQNHSKLVVLDLKNGSEISAYEPQIDDIMKAVEELNGKCGDIIISTE